MSGRVLMGRSQEQAGAEGQGQGKVRPQGLRTPGKEPFQGPSVESSRPPFAWKGRVRPVFPWRRRWETHGPRRAQEWWHCHLPPDAEPQLPLRMEPGVWDGVRCAHVEMHKGALPTRPRPSRLIPRRPPASFPPDLAGGGWRLSPGGGCGGWRLLFLRFIILPLDPRGQGRRDRSPGSVFGAAGGLAVGTS